MRYLSNGKMNGDSTFINPVSARPCWTIVEVLDISPGQQQDVAHYSGHYSGHFASINVNQHSHSLSHVIMQNLCSA